MSSESPLVRNSNLRKYEKSMTVTFCYFLLYVFSSLSSTIQGTLGKGESRPVRTSNSSSSRFLRQPSDYCSEITSTFSMVSNLSHLFHLNHFKIFILTVHLQMIPSMLYWTFPLHMTQTKPVFFSNYLFIYWKRLTVASKVFQEYQKNVK